MTQLSILGPPRGGRRVKSEREVLEESLSWSKPGNLAPVTPPDVTPSQVEVPSQGVSPVHSIVHPYFKVLGRFNVGSITKRYNDYVFHDLELPMGCWKELSLYGKRLPGVKRSVVDWSDVTRSKGHSGLPPADVLYGLMAVCYIQRGKTGLRSLMKEIRSGIFEPDAGVMCYTSTSVSYQANSEAIVINGPGWPGDHPFNISFLAGIPGPDYASISQSGARDRPSLIPALEGLLGENDVGRAKKVLEWAMGAWPAYLRRNNRAQSGIGAVVLAKDPIHNYYPSILAHFRSSGLLDARAIRADKINYIPK